MISRTTRVFRERFRRLPRAVQRQARAAYELWRHNPHHPSLHFRRVHPTMPIYSARIGRGWRALGIQRNDDEMVWFWIGSHADYDHMLSQL